LNYAKVAKQPTINQYERCVKILRNNDNFHQKISKHF